MRGYPARAFVAFSNWAGCQFASAVIKKAAPKKKKVVKKKKAAPKKKNATKKKAATKVRVHIASLPRVFSNPI